MLSLRELQLRMSAALTAPAATPGGGDPALLGLVNGGGALDPAKRVGIYADMYRAALVDVVREDFPRCRAVLGDEEFDARATRYLARHPSTHPSVRDVGRHFAAFVGAEGGPPFVGDLARLEWARVEVFDAPDAEPLRVTDLAAVPASDWPDLRLRPISACAVLECAWPVHEVWADADGPAPSGGAVRAALRRLGGSRFRPSARRCPPTPS